MKTIEQIALEVAQEMGLIANSVYEAFAKQVLAAYLEQQEPVAWVLNRERCTVWWNDKFTDISQAPKKDTPLYLAPTASGSRRLHPCAEGAERGDVR